MHQCMISSGAGTQSYAKQSKAKQQAGRQSGDLADKAM